MNIHHDQNPETEAQEFRPMPEMNGIRRDPDIDPEQLERELYADQDYDAHAGAHFGHLAGLSDRD